MKIFEFIGLSIYLVLIIILIVRQVNVSRNFRNNKIDEETNQMQNKLAHIIRFGRTSSNWGRRYN